MATPEELESQESLTLESDPELESARLALQALRTSILEIYKSRGPLRAIEVADLVTGTPGGEGLLHEDKWKTDSVKNVVNGLEASSHLRWIPNTSTILDRSGFASSTGLQLEVDD